MKSYIKRCMATYPRVYPDYLSVLLHLLTVSGNGIDMSLKGDIYPEYAEDGKFIFPTPISLKNIYPYSKYRPVPLKYVGSRNTQIREAAQHLIDCIKLTPDSIQHIDLWKTKGIEDLETLIKSEPIKEEYIFNDVDNTSIFLEKVNKSLIENPLRHTNNSVYDIKFFDVTWTDTPEYVKQEVRQLWADFSLGNDHYIYKTELNEELFESYPRIYLWLQHKNVQLNEKVIINWWW